MELVLDEVLEEESSKNFTTVKNEEAVDSPSESDDPKTFARQFLGRRKASVREELLSTVIFSQGVAALRQDRGKLDEFLQKMVDAKVLTEAEAAKGLEGKSDSRISKIRKVAEHQDVIFHPEINGVLQAGYSVFYEIAMLYEDLGADEAAIEKLHEILKKSDGPLRRKWLQQARDDLKPKPSTAGPSQDQVGPAKEAGTAKAPTDRNSQTESSSAESPAPQQETSGERAAKNEHRNVVTAESAPPISVILATPKAGDVPRIVNGGTPPHCLALGEQVGDDAVLLIHTKMVVLLSMAQAIEAWEFQRCTGMYLLSAPPGPNVTECEVIAIYQRGKLKLDPDLAEWPSDKAPVKLADRILHGVAGRRVHLFAKSASPGWESVVGEENWSTEAAPAPGGA